MTVVYHSGPDMEASSTEFSVFRGGLGVAREIGPNVLAFGKFDGLHVGHRELIARSAQAAQRLGLPFGVATFERHPYSHLRPGSAPPLLTGLAQKLRLFREAGARFAALFSADSSVLGVSAEDFTKAVLRDRMTTRVVVVGESFQFGRGGAGDISTIHRLAPTTGVDGVEVGTVTVAGLPVSASRIRARLATGDIDLVNELLGRPYEVPGTVTVADRVSAMVAASAGRALPGPGIYSARILVTCRRHDPALCCRVEVDRTDADDPRLVARWVEREMRGPPPRGPVILTFDAKLSDNPSRRTRQPGA